jgi:HlyD family secretion protein
MVAAGQTAIIHLQYDEEQSFEGRVKRVAPKGSKGAQRTGIVQQTSSDDVATFETLIQITDPPPELRLGMTANVEIEVDRRSAALIIPSQAVLHRQAKDLPPELARRVLAETSAYSTVTDPAKRYHQMVFVSVGGVARAYVVKTGISDQSRVEILSGLEEGDRVISGPYRIFEKLEDGLPVVEISEEVRTP